MYIGNYGSGYGSTAAGTEDAVSAKAGMTNTTSITQMQEQEESWEEKLRKWDEQIQQMKEENEREQERLQEERAERKRMYKKLLEKQVYKQYLARQDEISQLNEKISLERAVGEGVYIEKAPLSKSLSVAEIMAICGEI